MSAAAIAVEKPVLFELISVTKAQAVAFRVAASAVFAWDSGVLIESASSKAITLRPDKEQRLHSGRELTARKARLYMAGLIAELKVLGDALRAVPDSLPAELQAELDHWDRHDGFTEPETRSARTAHLFLMTRDELRNDEDWRGLHWATIEAVAALLLHVAAPIPGAALERIIERETLLDGQMSTPFWQRKCPVCGGLDETAASAV